jgi:hypothetical protein
MSSQTQIDFNVKKARERRDEGITRAVKHADAVSKDWSERAYRFLKWYITSLDRKTTFVIEDVRALAKTKVSLEDPPSARAWGSLAVKAVKAGLIKRAGYTQVRNPAAHRANCTVWQRA